MNFKALSELHSAGGVPFMIPMDITLVLIFFLILYAVICQKILGRTIHPNWTRLINELGRFALAYGTFSSLVGFFFAFGAIEESTEIIPLNVIAGGLRVGLITVLYGFGILLLALLAYNFLTPLKRFGGFVLAAGTFSLLDGLFFTLSALEEYKNKITFPMITALLYGAGIFVTSLFIYFTLRMKMVAAPSTPQ